MINLVSQHRSEIEALCRKHKVTKLELFGSATDPSRFKVDSSDVDFLYEIETESDDLVDRYFGFIKEMEALLGRRVDLVASKQIRNPFFLEAVNEQRVTVYAA